MISDIYGGANTVHVLDFDLDGDIDIVSAGSVQDLVSWWENDGEENFTHHTITGAFNLPHSVFAADINGDGLMDAAAANGSYAANDGTVTVSINQGNMTFDSFAINNPGTYFCASDVFVKDIDGDGDNDILSCAYVGSEVTLWENINNQSFRRHIVTTEMEGPWSVHAEDLEGDGDVDLFTTGYDSDAIVWWENDGNQNFTCLLYTSDAADE